MHKIAVSRAAAGLFAEHCKGNPRPGHHEEQHNVKGEGAQALRSAV